MGNVTVVFKAGYGGPLTVSMTASSPAINGPTFVPGDVGQAISVPGAGASGPLNTTIASVDDSGNGTAANAAVTTVTGVTAWFGGQVPSEIKAAIKLYACHLYENRGADCPMPRAVHDLLDPYRNLIA